MNLLAGTKLSTARDFRIEVKELKEALAENHSEKQSKKKNNREASTLVDTSPGGNSTVQQVSSLLLLLCGHCHQFALDLTIPCPTFRMGFKKRSHLNLLFLVYRVD